MTHKQQLVRRYAFPAFPFLVALAVALSVVALAPPALASSAPAVPVGVEVYAAPPGVPPGTALAPVPPHVEAEPMVAAGNQYCFGGPHPVHAANAAGATWDASEGRHLHEYPPVDLRLFALQDGCYYFIGDPADFGYRGSTYQYYGAHPVHAHYGGGWCFMIAGHAHWWRPWSSHFVVAGPWFYWAGAYDPFFWSYWPYYATYYRNYYPHYYGGGRYYRNWGRHRGRGWQGEGWGGGGRGGNPRGGWAVAPPIGRVVAPTAAMAPAMTGARGIGGTGGAWTAGSSARAGALGTPASGPSGWGEARTGRNNLWSSPRPGLGDGTWGSRAAPMPATSGVGGNFYRPAPAAPVRAPAGFGSSFRSAPSPASSSFRAAPSPSSGSFRAAPSSGFGSSFRTAPSVGGSVGSAARGIGSGGGWQRR